MKKDLLQKLVPHLIAVGIFLVIAVIYCSPALQGEVVTQSDITQWKGSIHESELYKEANGRYPLWTNALFSGMPTYQIGGVGNNYVGSILHRALSLGLPKPIQFFFLASLCFYIFSVTIRIRWIVGVLGALAFAYATYNPVIIAVGHDTKMWSMAYMPALLAGFIVLFEKRYWLGAAMITLFLSAMVAMNHLQIVYYTFLVVAIMAIFYIVRWVKAGELAHLGRVAALGILAVAVGVFSNAQILFTTYDYQQATIRGGGGELTDTTRAVKAKTGLDRDYAFSYSLGIAEPLVLISPKMYGGSNDNVEIPEEKSKLIENIRGLPQEAQQALFQYPYLGSILGQTEDRELFPRTYWGGIGGTSGPPYSGAAISFLAVLAFVILDNKHKWWALSAIVLSVLMSWGEYFLEFNTFLYNYLPFYNKFRAPSMIMVIPQLLIPVLAVMGVDRLASTGDRDVQMNALKKTAFVAGGFILLLLALYFSFDFMSKGDTEIMRNVNSMNQPQFTEIMNNLMDGLREDRRGMMFSSIIRSLIYMAIAAGLVFLMIRRTMKPALAVGALALLVFIDVIAIDLGYLNKSHYTDQEENTAVFQKTPADEQLQSDRSVYRVLNVGPDRFQENLTSYHYKSVGGYHPAKLRIYQDLIERQLSKNNESVLDMLNTKYLVQKDETGRTSNFMARPTAAGPAWFVSNVQFVKTADEEMVALDSFNVKQTAFVRENYRNQIGVINNSDTTGRITVTKHDNEEIVYSSESASGGFVVFSEVFYDRGWKAFIDNKEVPIVRTNYVLRGLNVPAGKHTIRFSFEPASHKTGTMVGIIANIVSLLIAAWAAWQYYRSRKTVTVKNG